jgi:manganese-dependent inorganic pyrophosphatase
MSEVLVIGHRNPDTDAVCSAIAYAEFKRRTGLPIAEAARCGDTNDRIDFVLQTFGMPSPRFVADVSPKVRDVMSTDLVCIAPETTAAEAIQLIEETGIRVLPVLDNEGRCCGLLSLLKLSQFLFPAVKQQSDSRRVLSSLKNLARILGGDLLWGSTVDQEEDLILMIGAMGLESFAKRLTEYPIKKLAVVVGDRWDIQNIAIREGVRVLIVTGGFALESKTLEAASRNQVAVILSPHDTATTVALCRACIAARHTLNERFLAFREDQPLAEARLLASESSLLAFPVLDPQGRTLGMLSKSDLLKKVDRKLILVDHNELSQAVHGAASVEILEIIDHHRIDAIQTSQPIHFRNEPVGSTCTIVADCFFQYGIPVEPPLAGVMLAGLVSDTLNLTSPTTTRRDHEVLARLEAISGIQARDFTERLFASGSVLISRTADQAITTDCKEYREGQTVFSVAQIEEVGFEQFWKRKEPLQEALDQYRTKKGYSFSTLLVTDVASQSSLLLVSGGAPILSIIDYPRLEPGVFELGNVVSRKKQLLPYFAHCLQRVGQGSGR